MKAIETNKGMPEEIVEMVRTGEWFHLLAMANGGKSLPSPVGNGKVEVAELLYPNPRGYGNTVLDPYDHWSNYQGKIIVIRNRLNNHEPVKMFYVYERWWEGRLKLFSPIPRKWGWKVELPPK